MKIFSMSVALCGLILLSACGGGGSRPSPVVEMPPAPDPFETAVERTTTVLRQAAQQSSDPLGAIRTVDEPLFGSVIQTRRTAGMPQATGIETTWDPTSGRFTATLTRDGGNPLTIDTARDLSDILAEYAPATNRVTNRPARDGIALQVDGSTVTVGVASIEWSNTNPTDYLAGGAWIHVDVSQGLEAEVGAFIDGPAFDDVALTLPLTGEATYEGRAAGGYLSRSGTGVLGTGTYDGALTLTADFAQSTISGTVSQIGLVNLSGVAVRSGYTAYLDPAPINQAGSFVGSGLRVVHPTIVSSEGSWAGRFANVNDMAGNPRAVAGTTQGSFTAADGTEAIFSGAFYGATERFP